MLAGVYAYLVDYIVLPEPALLVVAAWVMASYLADLWDRFPHLAITSPEGRCGKTRVLELLKQVGLKAKFAVSVSPAALYRTIKNERPTLLLDEAQSLNRRDSESSNVLYEIFCSGISKDASVSRCVGPNHEPTDFPVYCPKVVALIGKLQGVLPDRCLPILLRRKTKEEHTKKCRMREVEKQGTDLACELVVWSAEESAQGKVRGIYDSLDSFDIDNDRMAELLLPLQAVLIAEFGEDEKDNYPLWVLHQYAQGLEEQERQLERLSPGVKLLTACRELLLPNVDFMPTWFLIKQLLAREEEGWARFNDGFPITSEKVAQLLSEYDIHPGREKTQKLGRGYHRAHFLDAWERYLPPLPPYPENPAIPPNPPNPASPFGNGGAA
ncbi:MAG: DUF3631 domain-containing protein [Planctomycetes bacterium]|nr:DUF3631 domain-containing protein [Planctomycetota bacterium]